MFGKKKIIVLELKSSLVEEDVKKLEDKLSKKFGCKVIMLPPSVGSNLQIIR